MASPASRGKKNQGTQILIQFLHSPFDFVYLCRISLSIFTMLRRLRLFICLLYKSCSIVLNTVIIFLWDSSFPTLSFLRWGEQDCQLYSRQITLFCTDLMIITVLFSVSFLIIPNVWLNFSLLPRTEMTCLIWTLRFCSWGVNQLWHHNFTCEIKNILPCVQNSIYL